MNISDKNRTGQQRTYYTNKQNGKKHIRQTQNNEHIRQEQKLTYQTKTEQKKKLFDKHRTIMIISNKREKQKLTYQTKRILMNISDNNETEIIISDKNRTEMNISDKNRIKI